MFNVFEINVLQLLYANSCLINFNRYDNEFGYSNRVVDLLKYVYSRDHP